MAFVHYESQECTKKELDLFIIPATQTSLSKERIYREEYTDLARIQLFVKAKITKANGTFLDPNADVGPVNLFLHSLFSQGDVSLNERLISPSTITYPYRAMIETSLNYEEKAKKKSIVHGFVLQRHPWQDG